MGCSSTVTTPSWSSSCISVGAMQHAREGAGGERARRGRVLFCLLERIRAADAELEIAELDDVAVGDGRVLDGLAVDERPVPAAEVTDAEPALLLIELGVSLRDQVGRQHELEASLAADAEGQGRQVHPLEASGRLGDGHEDEGPEGGGPCLCRPDGADEPATVRACFARCPGPLEAVKSPAAHYARGLPE